MIRYTTSCYRKQMVNIQAEGMTNAAHPFLRSFIDSFEILFGGIILEIAHTRGSSALVIENGIEVA